MVILTSDGIADNFDPVIRKQVLASALPGRSPRASAAAQAAAASALNGTTDPDAASQLSPASPASCHARALVDMAKVLRSACSHPHPQPPQQQQQQQDTPSQPNQQQQQQPGGLIVGGGGDGTLDSLASTTASSGGGTTHRSVTGELPAFSAGAALTARCAVDTLIGFATAVTDAQRRVLEDAAMKSSNNKARLGDILANLPGKLDHASAVAYKVGS